jgi:propanol-preferring alcohol dehydrogenase
VRGLKLGERVGVPWLGGTCGHCFYCGRGQENLCDTPVFTGYGRDGGFATHVVANAQYCFSLEDLAAGRCARRAADVRRPDRLARCAWPAMRRRSASTASAPPPT